jgi:SAM-dependent methyltransferase
MDDGLAVPPGLQRSALTDRQQWIDSGVYAVDLLSRTLGAKDLSGVDVLDVGCGTKIVKTLLDRDVPVGRYVGVDVAASVIDWLRANVNDPRFEFHHFAARNDLYNPSGPALADFTELPVNGAQFDLICLFSVFTHLAPDDYVAMLRLTRRHIRPDGRLLFSVFIDEPDEPSNFTPVIEAALRSDDPAVRADAESRFAEALRKREDGYWQEVPDQPLMKVRYTRALALELIEGTGWEMVSVHPREKYIQHYVVCDPV